jgi:2-methylcitrate dehydratase PrpD
LRNEFGLKADEIESIALEVDPLVLELTGKKTPQVGLEGKFSVYHSAAVAIIEGRAGEAEYSDAKVRDPQVIALRDRVSALASQSVAEDECHVTIKLRNGRVLKRHVEHAIGSLALPMTDDDLNAKFGGLAEPALGAKATARLRELCWDIENLEDAAAIANAATPQA